MSRPLPDVKAVPDMFAMVPVVAEFAVRFTIPVPVYTPVFVIARSAPVVVVFAIDMMSFAVVGDSVVVALLQYPIAPDVGAVFVRFLLPSV